MGAVLKYLLVFVEVVSSLLLIAVILIQRSKEQGLGGLAFGGAVGESLFGAGVGNVLTKTTVILSIVFLVNTTLITVVASRTPAEGSAVDEAMPDRPVPAAPATPGAATADPWGLGDVPAADNGPAVGSLPGTGETELPASAETDGGETVPAAASE